SHAIRYAADADSDAWQPLPQCARERPHVCAHESTSPIRDGRYCGRDLSHTERSAGGISAVRLESPGASVGAAHPERLSQEPLRRSRLLDELLKLVES